MASAAVILGVNIGSGFIYLFFCRCFIQTFFLHFRNYQSPPKVMSVPLNCAFVSICHKRKTSLTACLLLIESVNGVTFSLLLMFSVSLLSCAEAGSLNHCVFSVN